MGRPKKEFDETKLIAMREEGYPINEISAELNVSCPTISRKIAELKSKANLCTKYRVLQKVQLTLLQYKILSELEERDLSEISSQHLTLMLLVLEKVTQRLKTKTLTENKED